MSLEGMFALTYSDAGEVSHQVKIEKPVDDMVNSEGTAWLCVRYSWLTGNQTDSFVATTKQIQQERWSLYSDHGQWLAASEQL